QAGGQRVKQRLGGVGAVVVAEQDGRLAGVDHERLTAGAVLLARAVEALDRAAVVGAVDPAIADAELEAAETGVVLDRVERPVHLLGVDAVAVLRGADGVCHRGLPFAWGKRKVRARFAPAIRSTTHFSGPARGARGVLHVAGRGGRPRGLAREPQLHVDVRKVALHGSRAEIQPLGDLV